MAMLASVTLRLETRQARYDPAGNTMPAGNMMCHSRPRGPQRVVTIGA
jgi:hypothetical protein